MPSFTAKSWWADHSSQGGGGGSDAEKVEAFLRKAAAAQGGDKAFSEALDEHPLWTEADKSGNAHLTEYWRGRLQPFYADRGIDLGGINVRFDALPGSAEGYTGPRTGLNTLTVDSTVKTVPYEALSTFLHESMHLVEAQQIAWTGAAWRSISDTARFGFSDEAQYNWKNYSDLRGASYD